jgi:glycosyltransferase involved in cell wall biosynthesis
MAAERSTGFSRLARILRGLSSRFGRGPGWRLRRRASNGRVEPLRPVTPSGVVAIYPELRSAVLERFAAEVTGPTEVLYWHRKLDLDSRLLQASGARQVGFRQSVIAACDPTAAVVAVPEPLWVRYWPRVVALWAATTVTRRVMRRGPVRFVTYAIDNLDGIERCSVPVLDGAPGVSHAVASCILRIVALTAVRVLDGMVFGSVSAWATYADLLDRAPGSGPETAIVVEVLATRVSGDAARPEDAIARSDELIFIGELSERKGLRTVLDAWEGSKAQAEGWVLRICGDGELGPAVDALAERDPNIRRNRLTRDEIFTALGTVAALVAPSQRVRRWREQIGLPLLEAESMGCPIIASGESGIARDLERRSGALILQPLDVVTLRAAMDPVRIRRLTAGGSFHPRDSMHAVARLFETETSAWGAAKQ